MGLLDEFSSFIKTPEGIGLLSAAAGMAAGARRGTPWNNLGRGALSGLTGYADAIERQQLAEQQAQAKQLRDMQIKQAQMQLADAEASQKFFADPSRWMISPAQQALSNGQGPTVENAAKLPTLAPQFNVKDMYQQMLQSGSPTLAQSAINALAKQEATKLKEIRNFSINGKVSPVMVFENGNVKTMDGMDVPPEIIMQNLGNRFVAIDKNSLKGGESFTLGVSPDAQLSASVQMRGQNMTDARAREANAKPVFHDGAWVTPPSASAPAGEVVKTPLYSPPKGSPEYQKQSSAKLLPILDEAEKLLGKSTGSYLGAGVDALAQGFGVSTQGAQAAAKLKALEGAIMMAQPRMEGPQSDKDTALYRQMAGQIGDATLPVKTRQAALETIKQLHEKYSGSSMSDIQAAAQEELRRRGIK